jgi:hypothetical protein
MQDAATPTSVNTYTRHHARCLTQCRCVCKTCHSLDVCLQGFDAHRAQDTSHILDVHLRFDTRVPSRVRRACLWGFDMCVPLRVDTYVPLRVRHTSCWHVPLGVWAHRVQNTSHIFNMLVGLARICKVYLYLFIAVHPCILDYCFCYYKGPVRGSDIAEPWTRLVS